MNETSDHPAEVDKRSEPRRAPDTYYSVQFGVEGLPQLYQFKIRDISDKGMCILVKDDSAVLDHLRVGDILTMTYYISEKIGTTEAFKTEVRHITPQKEGRFSGHVFVGLLILER